MSRHRRQASQALPSDFNVLENEQSNKAVMVSNVLGGGHKNNNIVGIGHGGGAAVDSMTSTSSANGGHGVTNNDQVIKASPAHNPS
ncbi:hypothetical protein Scep_003989 [Stephania cephalantha]|uniref:Uncharacterized protein n=1 Tax=Stephania cephalantha TaxID=152367 RepID=A0AAP0KSH6_9MAGN